MANEQHTRAAVPTADDEARKWHVRAVLLLLVLLGLALVFVASVVAPWSSLVSGIVRDIGIQLGMVGALAVLYESYAQRRQSEELSRMMSDLVSDRVEETISRLVRNRDVVAVYLGRESLELGPRFGSATHSIDVLATNLTSLEMYLGLLSRKAEEGVNVRILTLSPSHEFLGRRYRELGFAKPKFFFDEMVASLRHFLMTAAGVSGLAVKTYLNSPTLMLFRIDDRIVLGLILHGTRSRDEPHFEFDCSERSRGGCGQLLVQHFDAVWTESASVTLADLDTMKPYRR